MGVLAAGVLGDKATEIPAVGATTLGVGGSSSTRPLSTASSLPVKGTRRVSSLKRITPMASAVHEGPAA